MKEQMNVLYALLDKAIKGGVFNMEEANTAIRTFSEINKAVNPPEVKAEGPEKKPK